MDTSKRLGIFWDYGKRFAYIGFEVLTFVDVVSAPKHGNGDVFKTAGLLGSLLGPQRAEIYKVYIDTNATPKATRHALQLAGASLFDVLDGSNNAAMSGA